MISEHDLRIIKVSWNELFYFPSKKPPPSFGRNTPNLLPLVVLVALWMDCVIHISSAPLASSSGITCLSHWSDLE